MGVLGVVVLCGLGIVALTVGSMCELALWKPGGGEEMKSREGEGLVACEDETGTKRG